MRGVNNIKRGYNDFLLYGDSYGANYLINKIDVNAYYLFTEMAWNDERTNLPITTDGVGRGLFFYSEVNDTAEGWWCERNS